MSGRTAERLERCIASLFPIATDNGLHLAVGEVKRWALTTNQDPVEKIRRRCTS